MKAGSGPGGWSCTSGRMGRTDGVPHPLAAEAPAVRPSNPGSEPPTRLAEVVGSLSLATDLATGQPLVHGLRPFAKTLDRVLPEFPVA